MAVAESHYAREVANVAESVKELDPVAQVQAITGVVGSPDNETKKIIWTTFVGGLVGVLIIAVCGLIYLLADGKGTETLLTVFTSVLTGLVGLFAPSPVKGAEGGN